MIKNQILPFYLKGKRRFFEIKLLITEKFRSKQVNSDSQNIKHADFLKKLFSATYKFNRWGSLESRSGRGSELYWTANIRKELISIIEKYNIRTIFDTSCGDWNWMKEIRTFLPNYIGNDIVPEVIAENKKKYETAEIKFTCNDMISEIKNHNKFDLIICRHTLEHLPLDYALSFVKELKTRTKYAIITTNTNCENSEMLADGYKARGVNLEKEPFKSQMGEIISIIPDGPDGIKFNPALLIKFS